MLNVLPCTYLELGATPRERRAEQCLHTGEGFTYAFLAGRCTERASGASVHPDNCIELTPGVGAGLYLTAQPMLSGIVLTAAGSRRDFLGVGSDSAPPMTAGADAIGWPATEAERQADEKLRDSLRTCAALEPYGLCSTEPIRQICGCCPEAGGTGCSLDLSELNEVDVGIAAAQYRMAYLVLPLTNERYYFHLDPSGTRVWQGPLMSREPFFVVDVPPRSISSGHGPVEQVASATK